LTNSDPPGTPSGPAFIQESLQKSRRIHEVSRWIRAGLAAAR